MGFSVGKRVLGEGGFGEGGFGSTGAGQAAPVYDLIPGLVSWWSLNEASGDALDAHGSNHLAQSGAPVGVAGKVGTARQFVNASGQYLSIPSNPSLKVSGDFTIAGWVKLTSYQYFGIVVKQGEYDLMYHAGSNIWYFLVNGIGAAVSQINAPGVWHFLVAWYDSTTDTVNIQVNNGTPASTAHPTGPVTNAAPFYVGHTGGSSADGVADEVGFWKRVLTPAERKYLYNNGAGRGYAEVATASKWVPGILDHISVQPYSAYSFRKLRGAYAGPCCKVGTNDNPATYIDIPFKADGWVDEAAIAAIGTSANLRCHRYDQTGNGRHELLLPGNNPTRMDTTGGPNGRVTLGHGVNGYGLWGNFSTIGAAAYEWFRLGKWDTDPPSSAGQGIMQGGFSGSTNHMPYPVNNVIYCDFGVPARPALADPVAPVNDWWLFNMWAEAGNYGSFVNGAPLASGSSPTGMNGAQVYHFTGAEWVTSEDIIFAGATKLSTTERNLVVADMRTAYGIALSPS